MKNLALLFVILLLVSGQRCLSQNNNSVEPSESVSSPIIKAGNDLRTASNHLYASRVCSILSAGCFIGSFYLSVDATRDGSGNSVLEALGYGTALASILYWISSTEHIDKAGISLSEYGVGLKVPITGKK